MCARKLNDGGLTVCFYLLAKKEWRSVTRSFYDSEPLQITCQITGENPENEVAFRVGLSEGRLTVEGRLAETGSYQVLRDTEGNAVYLFCCLEERISLGCGRIPVAEKRMLTIGTDYRNDIFYDCFSFMNGKNHLLYQEENRMVFETDSKAESGGEEGAYINKKAVHGKAYLQKGDVLDIYGLGILVLQGVLICYTHFGTLRIAQRKAVPNAADYGGCGRGLLEYPLQRRMAVKESLLKEEVELEEIKTVPKREELPLFLTIGPLFSMILPTLMMLLVGRTVSGQNTGNFYIGSLVMTGTSACFSVFFSLANRGYQRKLQKKLEVKTKQEYLTYLQRVTEYLTTRHEGIREHLFKCYPDAGEIVREGIFFWNGEGVGEKSVKFRLGTGRMSSPITCKISGKKRFLEPSLEARKLYDLVERFRYIHEVPLGIRLTAGGCSGFVGEDGMRLALQLVIQAVSYYGDQSLKVVYFFNENDRKQMQFYNCIKWLPQIWQESSRRRLTAGNNKEAASLIPYLSKLIKERKGTYDGLFYLIVIADFQLLSGEVLLREMMSGQKELPCHTVFVADRQEELPGFAGRLIISQGGEAKICMVGKEDVTPQSIRTELIHTGEAERYMRRLYSIQKEKGSPLPIPEEVTFLQLYQVEKVSELHCLGRWKEQEEMKRIRVPIGISEKARIICLDVHEKFHGPHGLIAGTTGAGKSELLQTYLLSLAVSFSPESVNFFIIDYKGGGMGQAVCELPHCAGVISNLSGSRIKRALLSLKSEAVRRQVLFQKEGVNHIDAYGRLFRENKGKEPVPHLVLVVDEFAELKKEEPEFMQEIISISQIGRSLGIHLLLATQKPAGTVDDKIWSNTRFRLCLRVADRQDSMDMLKRPEAASLTGTGRCYLQVGNDEIFEQFQSGYSNAPYRDVACKETAVLVERCGERVRAESPYKETEIRQLEEVVKYVKETAAKAGYERAKNLWMEELPETLVLEEVSSETENGKGYVLGLYDDPLRQRQKVLCYEPVSDGHLCLCGMQGSGKSTFLQTFLWQICVKHGPEEAGFLLISAGDTNLSGFLQMPHCMGYVKEKKDAECFFYHLEELLKKRKERLVCLSGPELLKRVNDKIKPVFLVIDNYGSFREMTEDIYQAKIEKIAKEGAAFGIYLVLTALAVGGGELSPKLFENMKKTLSLTMSDPMRYPEVLRQYRIQTLPADGVAGRGLCVENGEVFELQIPVISRGDDYERILKIEGYGADCRKREERTKNRYKADKFPRLPDKPKFEELMKICKEEERLPIGYQMNCAKIQTISIPKNFPFLLSGEVGCGKVAVMDNLIKGLTDRGIDGAVFGTEAGKDRELTADVLTTEEAFDTWISERCEEKEKRRFLAIYDLPGFVRMMEKRKRNGKEGSGRMEEKIRKKELLLLAIHRSGQESELLGTFWYEVFSGAGGALHLGGNTAAQRLFAFDDISYSMQTKGEPPGVAYFKEGPSGKTKKLLIPAKKEAHTDDID